MSLHYIKVKDLKIPIIGIPDKDGKLSPEDYRATLKLNRHYIELAAEIMGAERELNERGGSLNMLQKGGIVREVIEVIKFLAPILKPMKDKFVNWYDKKYENTTGRDAYALGPTREDAQPMASGYLKPNQEMDYTLTQLRKHLKENNMN